MYQFHFNVASVTRVNPSNIHIHVCRFLCTTQWLLHLELIEYDSCTTTCTLQ